MNSKSMIIAGILVVAVVAIAGGVVLMGNGGNNGSSDNGSSDNGGAITIAAADVLAQNFTYNGSFGTFAYVADGATAEKAATRAPSTGMNGYTDVIWTTCADSAAAKALYEESIPKISAFSEKIPGNKLCEAIVDGTDNMYVSIEKVYIGASKFTMLRMVAYNGNTFVESYEKALYHAGSFATDAECSEILTLIGQTIGIKSVTVTSPADANATMFARIYTGPFGDFSLASDASDKSAEVKKDNPQPTRTPVSGVTFQVRSDAQAYYNDLAKKISEKGPLMVDSYDPTRLNISGATFTAIKYDVEMGGGSTLFTQLFFVGIVGNTVIESFDHQLYLTTSIATDDQVSEVFNAIATTLGLGEVTVTVAA